jgi:hypothetical protein
MSSPKVTPKTSARQEFTKGYKDGLRGSVPRASSRDYAQGYSHGREVAVISGRVVARVTAHGHAA